MRAIEAFQKALSTTPVLAASTAESGSVCVCDWSLPWLDGFELRENDDFIIAYHSAGSDHVRAACDGPWSPATSTPGLTSFIPAGRRVEYEVDGDVSFASIHIPSASLDRVLATQLATVPGFRFAFDDPFIRSCVGILVDQARRYRLRNLPYVNSITRALIQHVIETYRAEGPRLFARGTSSTTTGLNAALRLIDTQLGRTLPLEELAARAGMSRAHFVRCFRTHTGISPHRYINQRRVERAKELLCSPSLSLSSIALETGFNSQSHFTELFRATTGLTPGQYRRALQRI
jgi:AraC family transcriptional regulator